MTTSRLVFKLLFALISTMGLIFFASVPMVLALIQTVHNQSSMNWLLLDTTPTPFLYAPYYGYTYMNAVFDHRYPIYKDEPEEAKNLSLNLPQVTVTALESSAIPASWGQ